MMYLLYGLIATIGHLCSIRLRYIAFVPILTKTQKKQLWISYFFMALVTFVVYYRVATTVGMYLTFVKKYTLIIDLVGLFVNAIIIKNRWKEHFFTYGLCSIITYVSVKGCIYILFPVVKELDVITSYIVNTIVFIVLFEICYKWLKKLMFKTITPFLSIDYDKYWDTLWFIPIAIYYSCMFENPGEQHIQTIGELISSILILFAVIFICYSIAMDPDRFKERNTLQEQLRLQKKYYDELAHSVVEARKDRHDYKHHLAVIQKYIDTDDKQGLQVYCNQMKRYQNSKAEIPYTGNSSVDGVVYHYMQMAEEYGIEFQVKGVLRSCEIPDLELCVLIGNALSNAIEGSMTTKEHPYVSMYINRQNEMQSILIENSFDGNIQMEGETILSRKREHKTSGIGISSMQAICEKYGAMLERKYDEEVFRILIVLS